MSVVQPGGRQSGRDSGRGQRTAPSGPGRPPRTPNQSPRNGRGSRPGQDARGADGRGDGRTAGQRAGQRQGERQGQRGGQRSAQKPGQRPGQRPGQAPSKSKGRRNVPIEAAPPRRLSPTTMAIGAVAVVVVVVVALVVAKVASSGGNNNQPAPINTPASPSVVAKVTGVTPSVAQAVGLPTGTGSDGFVAVPGVDKNQPPLTFDGKPGALFIGGEFCPYCAAERWAIVMAFSRFGTFSNLKETTSTPWDVDPATYTFSFYGSSYSSPYLVFRGLENESNDTGSGGAGRHILVPLTSQESNLWGKYDAHFGVNEGFPFLDLNNTVFVTGPSYNPQVLQGLDWGGIARKLSNPKDPVTIDIVGTANYLTAGICAMTKNQPSSWCSLPVITSAAHALNLK
jgi:hypothetical protein